MQGFAAVQKLVDEGTLMKTWISLGNIDAARTLLDATNSDVANNSYLVADTVRGVFVLLHFTGKVTIFEMDDFTLNIEGGNGIGIVFKDEETPTLQISIPAGDNSAAPLMWMIWHIDHSLIR